MRSSRARNLLLEKTLLLFYNHPTLSTDKASSLTIQKEEGLTIYSKYCSQFRKRRPTVLAQFNHKCLRCGVRNRSFAFNRDGEIYVLFLHICHVFEEDKQVPDAPLIPLCPKCHWFFDHPRGDTPEGRADWAFIGAVVAQTVDEPIEQEEVWTA
jgi:hypothetical protein